MANITKELTISSPLKRVQNAIVSESENRAWWTRGSNVDTKVGGIADYKFDGEKTGFTFRFETIEPDYIKLVCVDNLNNPEWLNTTVEYRLSETSHGTKIDFVHEGWATESEMHGKCTFGWNHFLTSLKAYLETGTGNPAPNEVGVANIQ